MWLFKNCVPVRVHNIVTKHNFGNWHLYKFKERWTAWKILNFESYFFINFFYTSRKHVIYEVSQKWLKAGRIAERISPFLAQSICMFQSELLWPQPPQIFGQTQYLHFSIWHQACQGEARLKNMTKEEGTYAVASSFLSLNKCRAIKLIENNVQH